MISLVVANCDRRVSGRRLTRSLADFAKLVESFDGHGVSFVSVTRQFNTPTSILFSPGSAQVRQLFEWLACVRGADKGFDTADFVADMRAFNVTPHVAQNTTNRLSAVDSRTTRHSGYEISQQKRKRVEEPFGWGKSIGRLGLADAAWGKEARLNPPPVGKHWAHRGRIKMS
jgi:hypothetical protein